MIETLRQGELLLEALSDEQYIESVPQAFSSCIGSHYRHSLEHFVPLLTSPGSSHIDYDARERNPKIETERAYALACTRAFREAAESLDASFLDQPVEVCCSVVADAESPIVPSTMGREVMYAVIHAVHHYAIIRMMCNLIDVEQPAGFGVAPSTLRFRGQTAAAAD
jgi:hypothetical protein